MPKISTDNRFSRMIKFLSASREPKIAIQLGRRGFTKADADEGWNLLDKAAGRHLEIDPSTGTFVTEYRPLIDAIDDWENTWFDVANAALQRLFPPVAETLFHNLGKTTGKEVVINVRTFVNRLNELSEDESETVKEAMALLSKRGLTQECIGEVTQKLDILESYDPNPPEEDTEEFEKKLLAEKEAAVEEMWDWYKDWSQTARTVVKNRNHQIMLGLTKPKKGKGELDDEDIDELLAAEAVADGAAETSLDPASLDPAQR